MSQRIVLTGGPGAGKTTVLDILQTKGFAVGVDAARSIIQERKAAGLSPRPEPLLFAEQILDRETALFDSASQSPMFFERGVPEAVASLYGAKGIDEPLMEHMMARYRYDKVFLFPAWEAIYQTDAERDHTYDHAVRVCESIRKWYLRFDYEVIEVPLETPQARSEFILQHTNTA
tara:strand:+ start:389 stop:913 length:525 start_codon:yes stop_codon:yes gene_type:complete